MSTSLHSDPVTILLWGNQWWFAGGPSRTFETTAAAVEALAEHFCESPKPIRLRLLYQPEALRSAQTACPKGDRKLIGAALAADFPALDRADCAWSHEPILPNGEGYTTLLHFETEPGLFDLAKALALRGLAVVSAWPLVTFLRALPDEWTDTGAMTVIAVQANRALAHRHAANRGPDIYHWSGEACLADVSHWLAAILSDHPEENVLLVCADQETADCVETFLSAADHPGLESLLLANALSRRVVLPRYHPAQLLPPPPFANANSMMAAAGVALLLGAAAIGGLTFKAVHSAKRASTVADTEMRSLRYEIDHLRENEAAIAALRSVVDAGTGSPPYSEFLNRIGRSIPPEIVLERLHLTRRDITITGWLAAGSTENRGETWREALRSPTNAWSLGTAAQKERTLTLTGVFNF